MTPSRDWIDRNEAVSLALQYVPARIVSVLADNSSVILWFRGEHGKVGFHFEAAGPGETYSRARVLEVLRDYRSHETR